MNYVSFYRIKCLYAFILVLFLEFDRPFHGRIACQRYVLLWYQSMQIRRLFKKLINAKEFRKKKWHPPKASNCCGRYCKRNWIGIKFTLKNVYTYCMPIITFFFLFLERVVCSTMCTTFNTSMLMHYVEITCIENGAFVRKHTNENPDCNYHCWLYRTWTVDRSKKRKLCVFLILNSNK